MVWQLSPEWVRAAIGISYLMTWYISQCGPGREFRMPQRSQLNSRLSSNQKKYIYRNLFKMKLLNSSSNHLSLSRELLPLASNTLVKHELRSAQALRIRLDALASN